MDWDVEERPIKAQIRETAIIDEDLIQSGDPLLGLRMNGMDTAIVYASGSHVAHTTIAQRFDGELYVIEAMDVWYWPTHGIQRTKFKSWLKYADEADYNIVHLPLSPAKREIFNETAAIEKFFEWQGLPWGWHVVFFSLIDTPNDNLPCFVLG